MGVFLFSTLFSGFNAAAQGNWELNGNNIGPSQFLGTTNSSDLSFRTNNVERLTLKSIGTLGLGTTTPRGMYEIKACLPFGNPEPANNPNGWFIVTKPKDCSLGYLDPADGMATEFLTLYDGQCGSLLYQMFTIDVSNLSFRTGHTTNPASPLFDYLRPLMWAREEISGGSFVPGPNGPIPSVEFKTKFIVMENGECGINVAKPRAGLDVRGTGLVNYPNFIVGSEAQNTCETDPLTDLTTFYTKGMFYYSNLGNNAYNRISQETDQGIFFTDGLGDDGSNSNGSFIIAPWAENNATDIGGLRMDMQGHVELRGDLRATRVKVDAKWWSDFVFAEGYQLRSLAEVEAFIKEHKHLPDVPSEEEVLKNGIDLADMQAIQQQKIEELTLYIIQLQQQINAMQQAIIQLNGK